MEWLNIFGLVFMALIMIPNILFAVKHRDAMDDKYHSKPIACVEQIGRFGCFGFMIFNIPGTCFGWWSEEAFAIYLIVDTLLIAVYCVIWAACWKKNSVFRALALSVIPSAVFLFSGIMCRSILLILSSLLFAPAHIFLSYKNAD